MKKPGSRAHHGPLPRYGEIRYYICDADGYIVEVGQDSDPPGRGQGGDSALVVPLPPIFAWNSYSLCY